MLKNIIIYICKAESYCKELIIFYKNLIFHCFRKLGPIRANWSQLGFQVPQLRSPITLAFCTLFAFCTLWHVLI